MLLNNRIASIPCSSHHSSTYMNDIQQLFNNQSDNSLSPFTSQPTTKALKYFNMKVTQRLRHYRSMKKQWQEIATTTTHNNSSSPIATYDLQTNNSPDILSPAQNTPKALSVTISKPNIESKLYSMNDYINVSSTTKETNHNNKSSIEFDPLHSKIQHDLFRLRRLIKSKQKAFVDNISIKALPTVRSIADSAAIGTILDNQENSNGISTKKTSFPNKLKPLDRVKISGCQMHPLTISKSESTDSGVGTTSNSSSTCSQYLKQPTNNNKTLNINNTRLNPLSPELPTYRVSLPSKKKSESPTKTNQVLPPKQVPSPRLLLPPRQISPLDDKKQPSFIKDSTSLSRSRKSPAIDDSTTRLYTYAASSSSAIPRSMILKRNTSLFPILLQSSSCIGIQRRSEPIDKVEQQHLQEQEEQEEQQHQQQQQQQLQDKRRADRDRDYYHLLDYKHLIDRLPKPIVSIRPRYGQDDYGILFEQISHIRETMPSSNIYDDYTRII